MPAAVRPPFRLPRPVLLAVLLPLLAGPLLGLPRSTLAQDGPLVIAHRGASGYLPEHTLPAYAMAHAMGADYIEPDLVMSKDGVLIALHDIHLEATTDVAQLYPERKRPDGRWYAADFTVEEIKRLTVHERLGRNGQPAFPDRYPVAAGGFQIPTFTEVLTLVQQLNRLRGCTVGVYPETKDPAFHQKEGFHMEVALLATLTRFGYQGPQARVFIQSFDPENLKRIRFELKSTLPLVQLISGWNGHDALVTPEGLDGIATYANGIGPDKRRITNGGDLVAQAHARGLVVHPYTFRADALPPGVPDLEAELTGIVQVHKVDGFFTDHTDRAVALLHPERRGCAK